MLLRPHKTAAGNFLTFEDTGAGDIYRKLHQNGIITDHRADRLRFGFGLYQTASDVERLLERLQDLK